jgi:signal transduction histidine kinase
MREQSDVIDNRIYAGVTVQLALSCGLASGVTLVVFHWLGAAGLAPGVVVVLALLCGISAGLLATANMLYSVFLFHLALVRLAEGRPIEQLRSRWLWPLDTFFHLLQRISQRVDEASQRKLLTDEYREQLLQQASKAAAVEERNRLARELHDSVKQQLFSIRMSALAARTQVQGDVNEAQEAIEDIQRSADEAQVEMQALLQQLSSTALEHTSLLEAVQTQMQALEYRSGARVYVDMTTLPAADRFPLAMQEAAFRIIQEALANIARHARAQNVWCTIVQHEDTLVVTIRDDGQGFDIQSTQKGMGLTNIQERVHHLDGSVTIESESGKGTTIQVTIPLLLSQETREKREQQEREAQRMEARAQGGLQLRAMMNSFTLVFTIVAPGLMDVYPLPNERGFVVLIVGFCLLVMFYGLISTRLAVARISILRSEEYREMRLLRLLEHKGWASFLRLLLFALWYVLVLQPYTPLLGARGIAGLLFFLVEVLVALILLIEHRQSGQAMSRYYSMISGSELAWEVRQGVRQIWGRTLLSLCLALFLLIASSRVFLHFPPVVFWQWLMYSGFFIVLVFGIGVLIDLWQLQPWRKRAQQGTRVQNVQ